MSETKSLNSEVGEDSESQSFSLEDANDFLKAFGKSLDLPPVQPQPRQPPQQQAPQSPAAVAREAYWDADWDVIIAIYLDPATSQKDRADIREMMTTETGGEDALAQDPQLALIFAEPGHERDDNIADALLKLAGMPSSTNKGSSQATRDPKRFEQLASSISLDDWNDTGSGLGSPKRGLGPKICAALWHKGGYDEICKLIELGVDTTIPAQSETKGGLGVYSDFVQPLQHIIQKYLRDTSKLGTDEAKGWPPEHKAQVEGAAKIFKALGDTGTNVTCTEWKEVTDSEMLKEFKKNPGTIWGFEDVRLPFVQASHETPQGAQPLRMMELWDAVSQVLSPQNYEKLLANPKEEIKRVVEEASQTVANDIDTKDKYDDIRDRKSEYVKKFKADATKFLVEFVGQIPKGTFARASPDMQGQERPRVPGRTDWSSIAISDVTGIHNDKFMSSFACKAGLWWAKNEGKPVYYCLDGIDMDDVIDYKKAKNKTIQAYLSDGGPTQATKPHREVVTMKELREILRNWEELKDTVKFSIQGEILKGEKLKTQVSEWISRMEESNKETGRTPAPPRANYQKALDQIDPEIMKRLASAAHLGVPDKEVDMDARDIVKKAGYLLKVSKSRPEYVLKYLMSKCDVLTAYLLIPLELPEVAAGFAKLAGREPPVDKKTMTEAGAALIDALKKCPPYFRGPLSESLVKHPMIERDRKLKKAMKSN